MPNWCNNHFSINGPKDKIKELWDRMKDAENPTGLLEAMVPIGEWEYGKASEAWGTKWDVDTDGIEYSESSTGGTACISGYFDSAWGPPITAFATYADQNTDVEADLMYFEPGMSFTGQWTNEAGDDYFDIDPEDFSNIPEDLMEEFDIESWYEDEEDEEVDADDFAEESRES